MFASLLDVWVVGTFFCKGAGRREGREIVGGKWELVGMRGDNVGM